VSSHGNKPLAVDTADSPPAVILWPPKDDKDGVVDMTLAVRFL